MKTIKLVSNVVQKIKNIKIEKKQAEIKRYISYELVNNPEIKQEIYDAREILANYAKANNVRVALLNNARKKGTLEVIVSPLNSLDSLYKSIPETKDATIVKENFKYTLIGKDGQNRICEGVRTCEDNLLRRIYRTVEELTQRTKTEYKPIKSSNFTKIIGRWLDK